MKLHLPKGLRAALLACLISATGLAHADYTWIGGEIITTDKWKNQENWSLDPGDSWKDGAGPQFPNSDMWGNIVIDGASGEVDGLEGWSFKLNLGLIESSSLTIGIKKLQTGSKCTINVGSNSTLNINLGSVAGGNNGGALNVTMGYDSQFNMVLYNERTTGSTYIDMGVISSESSLGQFNLTASTSATSPRRYYDLNFTGNIIDKIDSTTEYILHSLTLGSVRSGVDLLAFEYEMQGSFIDAGPTATLTASAEYCGKYTVRRAEDGTVTLYYVTGALAGYTWNGTNDAHVWDTTETNRNWLNGDTAASYVTSDTIFKSGTNVSSVVTIGEDIIASRIFVEDHFSFEVANGLAHTLTATDIDVYDGKALTITGDGSLTITADSLKGALKVASGTLTVTNTLQADTTVTGGTLNGNSISGDLTVTGGAVTGSVVSGNIAVSGGTVTLNGNNGTTLVQGSSLTISNGGIVDLRVSANDGGSSGISSGTTVNINAGGTLRLTGHDMLGWGGNPPAAINLTGAAAAQTAVLDIRDSAAMTLKPVLNMAGFTNVTGTKFNTYGTRVNASGTQNLISVGEILVREHFVLSVDSDSELIVSSKWITHGDVAINKGPGTAEKVGSGKLIITGTASTWDRTFSVNGGTLQLKDGATLGTGAISLAKNTTLEIAGTKTLGNATTGEHVGEAVVGEGKLSVLAGATLTVTGNLTLGATIENAGTFTLDTAGSLSFTSKDELTKKETNYLDLLNTNSGNGYLSGSFYLINGASGSTASGISSVTVGGVTYTSTESGAGSVIQDDGSNVYITGTDSQKDLFYIMYNETDSDNDGTKDCVVYQSGSTTNSAANNATTGLVLDKAASETEPLTLVMKNNLNENATSGIIVLNDATIKFDGTEIRLNKATILQKPSEAEDGSTFTPTLTLTGTGTYVMNNAMGPEVGATKVASPAGDTDPGWTGTVEVTNTKLGGNGDNWFSITELNHLASTGTVGDTTQQTSTIKISGLSGYAYDGSTGATTPESPTVTADLVLKDIALTLTDAPLDADANPGTLTFSGDLSGDGGIVNNSDGHVTLSGDISGWTGSYTANESTSLLTLADGAKLNASVEGGSMKLLGALTLGKTMSLTGDLTGASTITLDGAALDPTKTTITVANQASGTGTLNFKTSSGDLSFLEDLPDGSEFKLLSAAGGIAGYDKATVNGQESSTQLAADGTEVRYYIAMNDTSVTLSKVTLGLTWHGDEINGWTSSTGFGTNASAQLTENSYVSFAGDGSSAVIVKEAQTVKGIAVDFTPNADRNAYILSGEDVTTGTLSIAHGNLIVQNKLTVNKLTSIHTGTSLTVEGESGSLKSEEMTNNGTLTIGSGSTVTVGSIFGDGTVGGDGMLVVSGEISADIIAKNTGTIELKTLDVATKGVQGTLLVRESGTFTGNYNSATSIGTMDENTVQTLAASEHLTVIGKAGTVKLTGLSNATAIDNNLGGIDTTGETVLLNNKTADGVATATTVTLGNASTMKDGVLDFIVSATEVNDKLKANDDKPTVTTGSSLSLKDVTLKVHEVENTGLDFNAGGKEKDILLFVLNDQAGCSVSNVTVDMSDCSWMTKYFTNFRAVEGSVDVIADANTGYYVAHGGRTPNGTAGLALAGKAMFHLDPRATAPNGELAQVLTMLDNHIATGNKDAMDKLGAALAGSSLSAVGLALADDVQRQLRSIRNRTTTMGVNECVVNEDMPYVNGWISGDGNYRQLSESGTDAGYQVSSWGGTVGVDVDVNPNLTLGVAVSALFGDYTGKAADTLTGDLDTQYVSLFARVSTGSWVNTFVGTLGRADVDLERTIPGVVGKTTYKTNGMMFGFLYEVARTFALNDEATTCVQPLFNMSFSHTTLDSATEGGKADTRLTTDSASLTQFSLGLGGRLQSVVGENEYNRASIFEARALLKLDFGDRYNKLNTALAVLPTATVSTRSNEKGVIGAELGATLTIPISQDAGSIFFDVNADFNADEVGVNGSVGYRVNF